MKLDVRVFKTNHPKVVANCTVTMDSLFAVHGIKVIKKDDGDVFVSMPSVSYDKDGKTLFKEMFHAITKEAREMLLKAVLEAYNDAIISAADSITDELEA